MYVMSDWDGGFGFDYVYPKFCPMCGEKVDED